MEIVYILVALAAALLAYFLFFKKGEPAQLPDKTAKPLPKPKPEAREKAPKKAEAPPPSAEVRKKEAAKGKEEAAAEAPPEQEVEEAPEEAAGRVHRFAPPDVQSMRRGLARSRQEEGIFGKLRSLFTGRREIDEDIAADIEEILLTSDVGVATTQAILERIRDGLRKGELSDSAKVWDALREEAKRIVSVEGRAGGLYLAGKPTVVLMVGVNGAGKTTTIGKLATKLKAEGKTCVLAAGDTFRAAAVEQLRVWGERVGCAVVHG